MHRFFKVTGTMLASLLVLAGSLLFLLTPWNRHLRKWMVHSMVESKAAMLLLGLFFLAGSALLLYLAIRMARRRELFFKAEGGMIIIDEKIFVDYLLQYWRRLFPGEEVKQKVVLKKDRVKIIVDFPAVPAEEQNELLKQIQVDLQDLFQKLVGYEGELEFTYSFRGRLQSANGSD